MKASFSGANNFANSFLKLAPIHVKIKEILSYIPIVCCTTFKMNSLDFSQPAKTKRPKTLFVFALKEL
jgi:hypothetical protein